MNGKFVGIIEVPKNQIGNAEFILGVIKTKKPKDMKKVEVICERKEVKEFKKIIALKDKPIINFITN